MKSNNNQGGGDRFVHDCVFFHHQQMRDGMPRSFGPEEEEGGWVWGVVAGVPKSDFFVWYEAQKKTHNRYCQNKNQLLRFQISDFR